MCRHQNHLIKTSCAQKSPLHIKIRNITFRNLKNQAQIKCGEKEQGINTAVHQMSRQRSNRLSSQELCWNELLPKAFVCVSSRSPAIIETIPLVKATLAFCSGCSAKHVVHFMPTVATKRAMKESKMAVSISPRVPKTMAAETSTRHKRALACFTDTAESSVVVLPFPSPKAKRGL